MYDKYLVKALIREVKKYPCIYDGNMQNTAQKTAAWVEISKRIDKPVQECKSKWRNIRMAFYSYLKSKPTTKPYYLRNELKFFMPFIKIRDDENYEMSEDEEVVDKDELDDKGQLEIQFTKNLIQLVKNRPCIYDINMLEHSQKHLIEYAWKDISSMIGLTVPKCKNKWKIVRATFKRKLKQPLTVQGYRYYDDLQFLIPYFRARVNNTDDSKKHEKRDFLHDDLKNLIEAVKNQPSLYDNANPAYRHIDTVEQAWKTISTEIDFPVTRAKEKWKNIRSAFMKSLKSPKGKGPYYLHDDMVFLIPSFNLETDSQDAIANEGKDNHCVFKSERDINSEQTAKDEISNGKELNEVDLRERERSMKKEETQPNSVGFNFRRDVVMKLIKEVEKRPCIYDFNIPEYNMREAIETAWKEISEVTAIPVPACKWKWRSLIQLLNKAIRRNDRPYYLHRQMQFMVHLNKNKEKRKRLWRRFKNGRKQLDDSGQTVNKDNVEREDLIIVDEADNEMKSVESNEELSYHQLLTFFDEVKKYPCLYNTVNCTEKHGKERAWNEISETTCLSVDECKHQWESKRDLLTKQLTLNPTDRSYILYNALKFFIPYLNLPKETVELHIKTEASKETREMDNIEVKIEPIDGEYSDNYDSDSEITNPSKRKSEITNAEFTYRKEFLNSLMSDIKHFDGHEMFKFKLRVFEVIDDINMDQEKKETGDPLS